MSRAGLSASGIGRPLRRVVAVAVALLPLLPAGCSRDRSGKQAPAVLASDEVPGPIGSIRLVGVAPSDFRCSSMATTKEVGDIVGGKVVLVPSQFDPPQGVAKPCNYVEPETAQPAPDEEPAAAASGGKAGKHTKAKRAARNKPKHTAKQTDDDQPPPPSKGADEWTVDFDCRKTAMKDAESLMVTYAKTDGAMPVRVGKSGLDYENAALLFIDDDSPCYARVLGPGASNRLAIAKLVAGRLTDATAPMTPVVRRTARRR